VRTRHTLLLTYDCITVKNPILIDDLARTELPFAWSQSRLGSEEEKSLLQSGFLLALCWSSYSEESLMDKTSRRTFVFWIAQASMNTVGVRVALR